MKTMWAMLYPEGRIVADSDYKNEADVWLAAIGHPLPGELIKLKKKGYKVIRITVAADDPQPVTI